MIIRSLILITPVKSSGFRGYENTADISPRRVTWDGGQGPSSHTHAVNAQPTKPAAVRDDMQHFFSGAPRSVRSVTKMKNLLDPRNRR